MTDWNKFKIKPGTLLLDPRTGITAIILQEKRDANGRHCWQILDSDQHYYTESDSWLRSYLRRGVWQIVQEVENEAG